MALVGIDVDGCVYPWTTAVNLALAERFGVADPGEHPSWNFLHDTLPQEQWRWVWSTEGAEAVFGRDLIYEGAKEAINALANQHKVHFVTHRNPYRLTGITGRYLQQHFRNYRGVHVLDNSTRKHTLADWDVFIDDKAEIINEFLGYTECLALMPDRPWNASLGVIDESAPHITRGHPRLERFEHWSEVPGLIV